MRGPRASRSVLRLHLTVAIVVPGCLAAGGFELVRALGGNELSWAYVVEWPLFGVFAVYMWWRLLQDEAVATSENVFGRPATPAGCSPRAGSGADPDDADPELLAWNRYLARLHASEPPDSR